MRVRDMSRRQQKAVFANMGTDSGSSSAKEMQTRRERLMRQSLLHETQQEKIDKIMQNNRLTHRQKMDRISKLKTENLHGSATTTKITAEDTPRTDTPAVRVVYQKALEKAEKSRKARKAYLKANPGAAFIPTSKPGVYTLRENGKERKWSAEELSYKQLKKSGYKFKKTDADGDGVANSKDCRPLNKNKQDVFDDIGKAAKKYAYSKTPEGRAKAARKRIRAINAKESAEKLEKQAKEKEAAYKKAHPKKFGLF